MSEQTAVATPSVAQESTTPEPRILEVPRSGTAEYTKWRIDGTLPEKKVQPKEESAPSVEPATEATTDDAADSAATDTQESPKSKRRPDVEERFKKLTDEKNARIAQLEKDLEEARRLKPTQAESSTAKPAQQAQPKTYDEWRKTFNATEWNQKYIAEHPDASWEEMEDARSDYKSDVREQFRQAAEQQRTFEQHVEAKKAEGRERYGAKFTEIADDTAGKILTDQQMPIFVKKMFADSEVFPDLIFTLGSDPKELESFLKMPPGKQVRYIALQESLIREKLESKAEPKSQEKSEPPVKPQTQAPKPPVDLGGRAASPDDALETAAKAGDFRTYKAEANRRQLARLKG